MIKIAGVKTIEKRRMEELREERECEREFQEEAREEPAKVGWKRGKNGRGRLTKRADAHRVKGRRRKGRPRLRTV